MRVLYYDKDAEENEVLEIEKVSYDGKDGTLLMTSKQNKHIIETKMDRCTAQDVMEDIVRNGYIDLAARPYYMASSTAYYESK